MSRLGVVVIIVLCISGLFLLISGIWLMLRGRPDTPDGATEATLKEVIRVNVPAQALLVLVGAGLLISGGYLAVTRAQDTGTSSVGQVPVSTGRNSPSAKPSPSPSPSTSLPPTAGQSSATLSYPSDGTKVSRQRGFIATGAAASLGPYTVWILDYDGGYTVDQEAKIVAGQWSATDQPLGDSSDHLPYDLTMVVALANPHCAARLTQIGSTRNDYTQSLPDGCRIVGQVTVNVSKP
jgi:hypothetical protein